jgi:hypothetical protein
MEKSECACLIGDFVLLRIGRRGHNGFILESMAIKVKTKILIESIHKKSLILFSIYSKLGNQLD